MPAPIEPGPGGGALAGAAHAVAAIPVAPAATAATEVEPAPADKEPQEPKAANAATASPAGSLDSLASCVPTGQTVKLAVHVANHVPAIKFVGHVDPTVAACITTAAKKLSLSVATGDLAVTLTK